MIVNIILISTCRSVFISNTDATTPRTFVTAGNRVIPSIQYVRMSETLWHRHIFNSCKSFHQSAANRKLLLATCLGRQPGSDVWVLSEHLQLSGDGQLIPENHQKYFWHPHYRSVVLIPINSDLHTWQSYYLIDQLVIPLCHRLSQLKDLFIWVLEGFRNCVPLHKSAWATTF